MWYHLQLIMPCNVFVKQDMAARWVSLKYELGVSVNEILYRGKKEIPNLEGSDCWGPASSCCRPDLPWRWDSVKHQLSTFSNTNKHTHTHTHIDTHLHPVGAVALVELSYCSESLFFKMIQDLIYKSGQSCSVWYPVLLVKKEALSLSADFTAARVPFDSTFQAAHLSHSILVPLRIIKVYACQPMADDPVSPALHTQAAVFNH